MADKWNVAEFANWLSLQEIPKRKIALDDLTSARLKRYNEWRTSKSSTRQRALTLGHPQSKPLNHLSLMCIVCGL
jgi:hypothetical protein